MRYKILVVSSLLLSVLIIGGGFWYRHMHNSSQNDPTATPGGVFPISNSNSSASKPISLNPTASTKSSDDTKNIPLSNIHQDNSKTIDTTTNDLFQYDQYKSGKVAMYQDTLIGTGAEVTTGKKLTLNYKGFLTSGVEFDDSYARKQPIEFVLGEHKIIMGWEEAIPGMRVGGKRRLIVPPAVGYGDKANGPIPANSVLVFDVELLAVR